MGITANEIIEDALLISSEPGMGELAIIRGSTIRLDHPDAVGFVKKLSERLSRRLARKRNQALFDHSRNLVSEYIIDDATEGELNATAQEHLG